MYDVTQLHRTNTREWLCLPEWVRTGLCQYVETGEVEAGTTLYAALCNDFKTTVCMAGADLAPVLRELAVSLSCYVPAPCHGSAERVRLWCVGGGLRGLHPTLYASQEPAQ
jgi:hypothetical protein